MSKEDFIQKNVVKGDIKITDAQYNQFVKEKRIPDSQITPPLKERIMTFLKETEKEERIQAYVGKLTAKNPVEVYFKKPKLQMDIAVGDSPVWGNDKAPITIIEFSDFQCPFCSRANTTIEEVKKKYGSKKVKIAFKHFPLPMHRDALPAAEASLCINAQSADKFWKFHDQIFKNQSKLDAASLEKYAQQSGADIKKFKECFESKKLTRN